jgi:hypothetical protein
VVNDRKKEHRPDGWETRKMSRIDRGTSTTALLLVGATAECQARKRRE